MEEYSSNEMHRERMIEKKKEKIEIERKEEKLCNEGSRLRQLHVVCFRFSKAIIREYTVQMRAS